MASPSFRATPRPNSDVIELLERVLQSAREGRVHAITIVVCSVLQQTEHASAGDLNEVRANVLLGGLCRAANQLLKL